MIIPLELAHLPYRHGETYEEYIGNAGYHRLGKRDWREHVLAIVDLFVAALIVDYVVLGGGNAKKLAELGPNVRLGANDNAFVGAFRLWDEAMPSSLTPPLGQGV